jgi:hypothetical protein
VIAALIVGAALVGLGIVLMALMIRDRLFVKQRTDALKKMLEEIGAPQQPKPKPKAKKAPTDWEEHPLE